MKIYKYWCEETAVIYVGNEQKAIRCLGGANGSPEEARAEARRKVDVVKRKLAGQEVRKREYDAEIREQILEQVDERNILTRNRYGAAVWNSTEVTILDIDQPRKSLFDFFGKRKGPAKEVILSDVRKVASQQDLRGLSFRVYETAAGIRLLILGRYFEPKDGRLATIRKEVNCDPLYANLCIKQDCFRARLTPKPYRMKLKGHHHVWPMTEVQLEDASKWLVGYEQASAHYAVCRYIETLGRPASSHRLVELHDRMTKATSGLPLA